MRSKEFICIALLAMLVMTAFVPAANVAAESGSDSLSADMMDPVPAVSIVLDVDGIDFGAMHPGQTSDATYVSVENAGGEAVNLSVEVEDTGAQSLFADGITVDGDSWSDYRSFLPIGQTGSFDVALNVPSTATAGSASGTFTVVAVAVPVPVADFSANVTSGPAPLTVQFTDLSENNPIMWWWDFGDGTTSTLKNPQHEYTAAGTYTVMLTSSNLAGSNTETKADYVTAITTPVADFSAQPIGGKPPLTVQFTDLSENSPASWAWDFDGDGTTDSTEQNPTCIYHDLGVYTVNLTVANVAGNDYELKESYITVTDKPIASFTASPPSGEAPLTVQFTDTSIGEPTSWAWDFNNDGTVDSTDQNPSWQYADVGTYTVNLTATNEAGSDYEVKTAFITTAHKPVADFTTDVVSGQSPLAVQFTDISTNSPTSWQWDFNNDGTIDSTEQSPLHEFNVGGVYTVNLTVANVAGSDYELKSNLITVTAPPAAQFRVNSDTNSEDTTSSVKLVGVAPFAVHFTDASTGYPYMTSWQWDFNNDGIVDSTDQNPSWTYASIGNYTVKLTVTSSLGTDTVIATKCIQVTAWSQFQSDQQHTGYYAGDAPDNNNTLWTSVNVRAGGEYGSGSVAIGEGKVFVCGYTNKFGADYISALDINTGALVWQKQCLLTNIWGSWASPVYHDGLVFNAGDVARYASNGEPAWPEGNCLADGTNGGPLVADGKVFQAEWETDHDYRPGGYYCYDEKTGDLLWYWSVGTQHYQGVPAYHNGKLFVTSYAGVYCLDADTGIPIWQTIGLGASCCGSCSIAYGFVYVTTYNFYGDGKLVCMYESNGTIKWSETEFRTDATPAIWDGKVYISAGYGSQVGTYCFDAYTGQQLWLTLGVGIWTMSAVVADGKVFVGACVLDPLTGERLWNGWGTGTATIYDDKLFLINGGVVTCFGSA
jgi:PKD repeat protein